MKMRLLLVVVAVTAWLGGAATLKPSCDSPIYCYGELLHTVQMAEIFQDSKTFVDFKMNYSQDEILKKFSELMDKSDQKPTKEQISDFVYENFSNGTELEEFSPDDYNPNPAFLSKIKQEKVKDFAKVLTSTWPKLARRIKDEVKMNPERYSIIPVPNGFIIPGGRFREIYYWDTYWIINGLLISEMHDTARGMLDNFISLIKQFGFIPNGSRVYYLNRSQPPLFVPMCANYFKASKDVEWLKKNIKYLSAEAQFWLDNKFVDVVKTGTTHRLAHYLAETAGPRPESYKEDYKTVSRFPKTEQQRVYTDLKSGAESGWDYTSRWFYDDNGEATGNLTNIHTRRTIPVDLNAFLYKTFSDLSYLHHSLGKFNESNLWKQHAEDLKASIKAVLWNDQDGIWYDYDLKLQKPRKYFAVSNLAPLWANAYNKGNKALVEHVLKYLKKMEIFDFRGGTPATLEHTGEQWDFPNAWPPLQAIIVQGLANTKSIEAKQFAEELAKIWVNSNILGYDESEHIYEKYDATQAGKYGEGGEYNVQTGFGWTNGVALEFINKYFT